MNKNEWMVKKALDKLGIPYSIFEPSDNQADFGIPLPDGSIEKVNVHGKYQYQVNGKPAHVDYSVPGGCVVLSEDERLELVPVPLCNLPRRISRKPSFVRVGAEGRIVRDFVNSGRA